MGMGSEEYPSNPGIAAYQQQQQDYLQSLAVQRQQRLQQLAALGQLQATGTEESGQALGNAISGTASNFINAKNTADKNARDQAKNESDVALAKSQSEENQQNTLAKSNQNQVMTPDALTNKMNLENDKTLAETGLTNANTVKAGAETNQLNSKNPVSTLIGPEKDQKDQYLHHPITNSSLIMLQNYNKIQTSATKPNPTASDDLDTTYSLMHLLDPSSRVTKDDEANATNAAGIPERIRNVWNRLRTGESLTPTQRMEFSETSKDAMSSQLAAQSNVDSEYGAIADSSGLRRNNIVSPIFSNLKQQLDTDKAAKQKKLQELGFGQNQSTPSPGPQAGPMPMPSSPPIGPGTTIRLKSTGKIMNIGAGGNLTER